MNSNIDENIGKADRLLEIIWHGRKLAPDFPRQQWRCTFCFGDNS